VFAVGAALIAVVAIASWFMVRSPPNNSATPDQICSQDTSSTGLAACTQAIALNPKDELAFANRCGTNIDLGNYSAAIADCNQAIALNPKSVAYLNRCVANYDLGHYRAGVADCNQAIAFNPKDEAGYDMRAFNYEKLGETAEAIADYQKALTINASDQTAKDGLKRLGASAASGGR
jgi:tetratricopeptide (TPR) repeat protein